MKQLLGTGVRYYSWGDHWGWHIGFSRYGLNISTPIFELKLQRRTRWYGERACIVCGEGHSGGHPDPCIGELPGVMGSCCGHGDRTDAYIGWENGLTIRGFLVDDGRWLEGFDMEDWVPEEADYSDPVVVNGVTVFADAEMDEEAFRSLGEMVWEVARYQKDRSRKIHRAVHGKN